MVKLFIGGGRAMKKVVIILLSVIMLTGCGKTVVSQEEYDSVVAEKDDYKQKFESLEKTITFREKLIEYNVSIEKDYEKIKIMFDLYEAFQINGADSLRNTIDEMHESLSETISSAKPTDMNENTMKALDGMYIAWNDACAEMMRSYNEILKILPR